MGMENKGLIMSDEILKILNSLLVVAKARRDYHQRRYDTDPLAKQSDSVMLSIHIGKKDAYNRIVFLLETATKNQELFDVIIKNELAQLQD